MGLVESIKSMPLCKPSTSYGETSKPLHNDAPPPPPSSTQPPAPHTDDCGGPQCADRGLEVRLEGHVVGKAALVLLQRSHATRLADQALAVHEVAVAASLLQADEGEGGGAWGGEEVEIRKNCMLEIIRLGLGIPPPQKKEH